MFKQQIAGHLVVAISRSPIGYNIAYQRNAKEAQVQVCSEAGVPDLWCPFYTACFAIGFCARQGMEQAQVRTHMPLTARSAL